MRCELRTLLLLLAILPPLLAVGWWQYCSWRAEQERQRAIREEQRVHVLSRLVEPWIPGDEVDLSHGKRP